MNRRGFLRTTGGAAIIGMGVPAWGGLPASAQGADPLAEQRLPEVAITLTEAGFEVSPRETPAGWTLVTFENGLAEGFSGLDLMLLPADQSIADVMALMATPVAEAGAPPAWVYDTTWAGGPLATAGESARAVVNLTAGDWMVWSGGEAYAGAALTVTAATAAATAPSLTAEVAVEWTEFAFAGLEEPVPAGPRVWKVTNTGAQPHLMVLFAVPDGTTTDSLLASFMGMMSGTPTPGGLDVEQAQPVGGAGTLSAGQFAWLSFDLAAGSYGAVCFFPDEATGAPHLMLGMATVFTVA